jgi:hypothetical protein
VRNVAVNGEVKPRGSSNDIVKQLRLSKMVLMKGPPLPTAPGSGG